MDQKVSEDPILKTILSEYRTKNFVVQKLEEFSSHVKMLMPKNLVAMTLYYQFSLFEIPKVFLDYQ